MQSCFELKITQLIDIIERERGPFKVKCLVAQDPNDIHWDLILWADWFEQDEMMRLDYLVKKISAKLDYNCIVQFNAIVTFPGNNENDFLRTLSKIQEDYCHLSISNGHNIEIRTNLPQARLVIPLNR